MSILFKLVLAEQLPLKNFCTKFHENMTGGLVTVARSWTDMVST